LKVRAKSHTNKQVMHTGA